MPICGGRAAPIPPRPGDPPARRLESIAEHPVTRIAELLPRLRRIAALYAVEAQSRGLVALAGPVPAVQCPFKPGGLQRV